jgi:hypothetical protein
MDCVAATRGIHWTDELGQCWLSPRYAVARELHQSSLMARRSISRTISLAMQCNANSSGETRHDASLAHPL